MEEILEHWGENQQIQDKSYQAKNRSKIYESAKNVSVKYADTKFRANKPLSYLKGEINKTVKVFPDIQGKIT